MQGDNDVIITADSGTSLKIFGGTDFKSTKFMKFKIVDVDDGKQAYLEISQDNETAILYNEKPVYDEKTDTYTCGAKVLKLDLRVGGIEPEFDLALFKNRLLSVECVDCGWSDTPKFDI